jgi:hypothetical protein
VNITLWIITGVLAALFSTGGMTQLLMTKERYRAVGPSQYWVDDFDAEQIKAIATIKLIGCVGLIVPAALGVATVLTPLAACGLALFMSGAASTRFRRKEWKYLPGDLVYLGLFAFVAWGRFDLQLF